MEYGINSKIANPYNIWAFTPFLFPTFGAHLTPGHTRALDDPYHLSNQKDLTLFWLTGFNKNRGEMGWAVGGQRVNGFDMDLSRYCTQLLTESVV